MQEEDYSPDTVKKTVKKVDNFLYAIVKNVICTICQELFSEPVTNECGHSFCSKCLNKLRATSKYGKVNCPLCRHPINRRSGIANSFLTELTALCSDFPAAFKTDVMRLTRSFEEVGRELIKNSTILGFCEEKVKGDKTEEKKSKKCKKSDKVDIQQTVSNDSVVLCSVLSNNEENANLKSVSQISSKSQSCFVKSPIAEKKLKNVMRIGNKEKVGDWLQNVNKSNMSGTDGTHSKNDGGENLLVEPNERKPLATSSTSMVRIDYVKLNKSNGSCSEKTLTLGKDDDPYEFIASQRNSSLKRKRASRGRKRAVPQFEAIQSFDKGKLMKCSAKNNAAVFDDDGSSVISIKKPVRTYCTRSRHSKTTDNVNINDTGTEEIITQKRTKKVLSDIEDSCLVVDVDNDDSIMAGNIINKIKPRARRKILPTSPINDSFDSNILKKPKMDYDGVNEKVSKSGDGSSKCTQSPGWSRVSHLKMDFESADKRSRSCRKTLDISGGELNVNTSKMKHVDEISLESDKKIGIQRNNDMYIENLGESSDLVLVYDRQHCKNIVPENAEKERKRIVVGSEFESKSKSKNMKKAKDGVILKTPNRKKIPFAPLGKTKNKNKRSIAFVKMGRLSPHLTKSDATVIKPLCPSVGRQETSVAVQTDESTVESYTALVEGDNAAIETKVDVGVQTSQNMSISKEVQTIRRHDQKSIAIQTEVSMSSQMFEEFNTSKEEVSCEKKVVDIDLDTELQFELNKTWAATQAEKIESLREQEREGTNIISNVENELIKPGVQDNMNRDLVTATDYESFATTFKSSKATQQCQESDSDIFIEQTPPRDVTANGGRRNKEAVENGEESFLLLSECQSSILEPDKPKFASMENVGNNENDQNGPNKKLRVSVKDRRICIVSSGIRNRKIIEEFVKRFKVEHSNFPKKDMTHLIVGLHENEDDEFVPYCTPKFLYAIANKKWIVTESWIEKCLISNGIVPEEPFESVDPVGGNGCNVARLSTSFLLENYEVYLYGKFVSITKQEFGEFIEDCGGTIVSHFKDFSYSQNKIRMILVDGSGLQEKTDYELLSKTYRTLVMSRDVAIMSIQSYQMVNFTSFVQHRFSTEECVKWGYPLHLVKKDINLEESYSDCDTNC